GNLSGLLSLQVAREILVVNRFGSEPEVLLGVDEVPGGRRVRIRTRRGEVGEVYLLGEASSLGLEVTLLNGLGLLLLGLLSGSSLDSRLSSGRLGGGGRGGGLGGSGHGGGGSLRGSLSSRGGDLDGLGFFGHCDGCSWIWVWVWQLGLVGWTIGR